MTTSPLHRFSAFLTPSPFTSSARTRSQILKPLESSKNRGFPSVPVTRSLKMTTASEGGKKTHLAAMDDVKDDGSFNRRPTTFRNKISNDPDAKFKPEAGRYHLIGSLACPWFSRVLAMRSIKGLQDVIPLTVVHHHMDDMGWRFVSEEDEDKPPLTTPDPLFGFSRIREFYFKAEPDYAGRFTVPVLWDTELNTIVNNESSELIVMLNSEFNAIAKNPEIDLYPEHLREEIDKVSESFYNSVNNGVYRCGFARKQQAYDIAVDELFDKLDELEVHLSKNRYLVGNQLTLADIRLFVTLIRFDIVYITHFKTNKKKIADYPALRGHTTELYNMPAIKETVNFEHIKKHYFCSHPTINPFGIVPAGPDISYLDQPHGRDNM